MRTMILYHKYLNFHKIGEMQQKWNLSNMRNIGCDQELFPAATKNYFHHVYLMQSEIMRNWPMSNLTFCTHFFQHNIIQVFNKSDSK